MNFPTFVYKCPGPHPIPRSDKTYQYVPVDSEEEMKQRLEEGWYATKEEAADPPPAKPVEAPKPVVAPKAAEAPKPVAKTAEPVKPKA